MAARKRKTEKVEPAELLIENPVEEEIFDAMDKAIAASAEEVAAEETPAEEPVIEEPVIETVAETQAEAVEETPKPEKRAKTAKKNAEIDAKPEEKSGKVSKSAEKSLEKGEISVFSARIYPSSISKQVKYLAIGKAFIVDTEVHDGRIRISADEAGLKIGWADVEELKALKR